jgi:hypothetical protein
MKKIVFVFLLVTVQIFAIDMDRSLEIYRTLVDNYAEGNYSDEFLSFVNREIKNLSLYRYYRLLIAGSIDKREATPDVGDYLGVMYDHVQADDEDQKLAYALFLSYLVSQMEKSNLSVDVIMKNNAFIKFFSSYRDILSKEARTFFTWIICYKLGLTDTAPPVETARITSIDSVTYSFQPPEDLPHIKDLSRFYYSDPSVVQSVEDAVKRILDNFSKDPSRLSAYINREAAFLARDISKPVTTFQAEVAQNAVLTTPKNVNLWWIRYIVYIVFIVVALRYRKLFTAALSFIASVETIYLLLFFDFLSSSDSLIYGILAVFGFVLAFILSLRTAFRKKRFLDLSIATAIILFIFIPFVPESKELSMENYDLRNSVYYSLLKKDLFQDELSKISYFVRDLSSVLYVSMDETKTVLNDVADVLQKARNLEAIDEISVNESLYLLFSNKIAFYNSDNFMQRTKLFSGLAQDLGTYVADEKSRKSEFESAYRDFSTHVKRIMTYSADYLRKDFADYIEQLFLMKYPILSNIAPKLSLHDYISTEVKKPSIPLSREKTALSIALAAMFVFFVTKISGAKVSFFPSLILAIFSIVKWFSARSMEVFVEQGLPTLVLKESGWFNPGIFFIAVLIFGVNLFKLFRKGADVL